MLRIFKWIFWLLVLLAAVLFSTINAQQVSLDLYFKKFDIPLSFSLIVALAIGSLLGVFSTFGVILRQKRRLMRLSSELKIAKKSLPNYNPDIDKD